MRDELSRRAVVVGGLTGLAACGSTAGKSSLFRGNDRPIVEGPGTFGRNISCDNDTILQSALDGRLSQFADFADLGTCRLTPDSFEGPYFTCVKPRGKDITDGRAGQPLAVAIQVTDDDCNPIENAIVDIWACDAEGNYSAFTASPDEFATSGTNVPPETDERFCRGVMKTDKDGIVEFDTLYPGYYAGRAIHIHYKVHIGNKAYITNQALFLNSRHTINREERAACSMLKKLMLSSTCSMFENVTSDFSHCCGYRRHSARLGLVGRHSRDWPSTHSSFGGVSIEIDKRT